MSEMAPQLNRLNQALCEKLKLDPFQVSNDGFVIRADHDEVAIYWSGMTMMSLEEFQEVLNTAGINTITRTDE
jgi:hydrogenase maturation factor